MVNGHKLTYIEKSFKLERINFKIMICRTLKKASSFVCKSSLFAVLIFTMSACNDEFSLKETDYNQKKTRTDQALEVWDGSIANEFNGGDGTAESPYLIANGRQLARFAAIVNGTNGLTSKTDICGKLTENILLNDTTDWKNWEETIPEGINEWTPIGNGYYNGFTGTLDGDGHTVNGIYINKTGEVTYMALIGYSKTNAVIKNLGVANGYIKAYGQVAGICGNNAGAKIINCHNGATIIGSIHTGGIAGNIYDNSLIEKCYNTGHVFTTEGYAGGICATISRDSEVRNCYNTGYILSDNNPVGGITGNTESSIINCYNTGDIRGGEAFVAAVGGIFGSTSFIHETSTVPTITNCYNTGNISGDKNVGGIGGSFSGFEMIENSQKVTISNCFNTGNVTGNESVGSLCGSVMADMSPCGIENCYYLSKDGVEAVGSQYIHNPGNDEYVTISIDATAKDEAQFKSGEVAYLLQGEQTEHVWGQAIGEENIPILGGKKVFLSGDGSYKNMVIEGEAYVISSAEELYMFASMANENPKINGKLTADIVLNSDAENYMTWGDNPPANQWTPINMYAGMFDGQGHNIKGLYLKGTDKTDATHYPIGLFASLNGGTVQNLGVIQSFFIFSIYDNLGGIVGKMYNGTVRNCFNTSAFKLISKTYPEINDGDYTFSDNMGSGGIVGVVNYDREGNWENNNCIIEKCFFDGKAAGEFYTHPEEFGAIVGGMFGHGIERDCFFLEREYNWCWGGRAMREEQFNNGEVAYRLGEGWGQTIGEDYYPVLTNEKSKKVYEYTAYTASSNVAGKGYFNNGDNIKLTAYGPNTLAFVENPEADKVTGDNVILKNVSGVYSCKSFVITDGANFYTPFDFTAETATFKRTPKVWAQKNSNGSGWETICVPFNGSLYADGNKLQPVDRTSNNGNYWLRNLTGFEAPNTLLFTSPETVDGDMIKAGVPYLIALPGSSFGGESLEGKNITIVGKNVAINNSRNPIEVGDGLFIFTSEYTETATNNFHYRLNSELNEGSSAGDLFKACAGGKSIPFRCRIEVNGLNIGGAASRSGSSLPQVLRIGQ